MTTDEDVLNAIRRELRKVTEMLVPTETIAEVLRSEVLKREALEGDDAINAARLVARRQKSERALAAEPTTRIPADAQPAAPE